MASLQLLPLCFLLVTTQGSSEFPNFTCVEDVTAALGKTINLTCENNKAMLNATVKFCHNETSCPKESDLNSISNKYITDNGRISLMVINQSVILSVHKVKISDQRHYKFFLEAVNGDDHNKIIYLKVVAPYSEPQIKIQKDTVVCTASGGHPQRQLYWFGDHGTNLTHNSKLVSLKNEDGSFSLISTLQRHSLDSGTICCSILNNNTNCDNPQGSALVRVGNETTTKKVPQDAEKKILIPVFIIVILAAICAATFFHCRKKKGAIRNTCLQRLFLSEEMI
ncbi:CD276 antigen-like [Podarcis lilfordi]|uniref:CD276 antigen-like n=1 Tax=Podarcis lilfordi TaxID=74358 RepID=A0AA35NYE7_9SAUR|nr:CD276 antigen-like [Podarcis lilfordi]